MRTVDDVLRVAESAGVTVLVEGYDLVLEHEADPPPQPGGNAPPLQAGTRQRASHAPSRSAQPHHTVDQRPLRFIATWRLRPLRRRAATRRPFCPAVRRKRSGRGARLMSFSLDSAAGGPSAQCAPAWDRSNGGDRAAVKLNDRSTMMRRRTGKTNDMTAGSRRFASHATQAPPATRAGTPKKEVHSRDSASGPRTAPRGLQ